MIRVAWGYQFTTKLDNIITGIAPLGADIYSAVITLKENWHDWSSNSYTLDYPVEFALAALNGEVYGDLPIDVQWTYPPHSDQWGFQINQSGLTPYIFDFDLPAPPSDYWLQTPFFY